MEDTKILEIIRSIRAEFQEQLKEKTGWGRVEAAYALERAISEALAKHLKG